MLGSGGTFGYWLDVMMSNEKVTGRDIARKLDIHETKVSRWRSGKAKPTMEEVEQLAELFNVEPLRLAVLAKLITEKIAGVPPVDIPRATAQREEVKAKIKNLPGLTKEEVIALIERYDELELGME